jgi:gamma-glutamyltranspeptidase/glutathione hydrolase
MSHYPQLVLAGLIGVVIGVGLGWLAGRARRRALAQEAEQARRRADAAVRAALASLQLNVRQTRSEQPPAGSTGHPRGMATPTSQPSDELGVVTHCVAVTAQAMVVTADRRASEAGLGMLRSGGSAVDAAVAANAVLAVTAPHLCGMGGDLFALVHRRAGGCAPVALNASGPAGSGADPGRLRAEGHAVMPFRHDVRSVTVPGCVDGWLALHERYGRLPLREVFQPAAVHAGDGFSVSPLLAESLALLDANAGAGDLVRAGPAPPGQVVRRPGVARALAAIVTGGRAGFYQGEFGTGLLELGAGYFDPADLARPSAEWVEPLSTRVLGHEIWTPPPNSQGYLTLLALRVAEGLDLPCRPDDPLWPHLLIEAARQAAHDRPSVLHERANVRCLLTAEAVAIRRRAIDPARRGRVGIPAGPGGTTYLAVVDAERLAVSLIQSNCAGFGSHLFEPRTGINLHNRGVGFSLQTGHPAEYRPGRRPPHTLCPALITRPDGSLRAVLGTMGGDSQPQILLQVVTRLLRHGEPPEAAIGAPRWVLTQPDATSFNTWSAPDDVVVRVERAAPEAWVSGLARRGHRVHLSGPGHAFGHAHLIDVAADALTGAADARTGIGAATGY